MICLASALTTNVHRVRDALVVVPLTLNLGVD